MHRAVGGMGGPNVVTCDASSSIQPTFRVKEASSNTASLSFRPAYHIPVHDPNNVTDLRALDPLLSEEHSCRSPLTSPWCTRPQPNKDVVEDPGPAGEGYRRG